MKRFLYPFVRRSLTALTHAGLGAFLVLLVVGVLFLDARPDLKVWHEAELDEEFTRDTPAQSFRDYLALEERLFQQLDEQVYQRIEPQDRRLINRYHRGSLADPDRWSPNWNRSFELSVDAPEVAVLLLHGMSDSPYSLRYLGQRLQEAGAWVVGLRLPGHGTAPSGLVEVQWQDMAAAVRLALRHLRDKVPARPLYIVGYSNGGALAVQYALSALREPELPVVDGLVLISPAIGVTSLAAFAVWQARLGHLLGLDKLAWNAILPEYDPFKYGSFAVNAGDQVYRLTAEIQSLIEALKVAGALDRFPSLLAFQSLVDATVSAPALVEGLFERLPAAQHELVLFDINRVTEIEPLLQHDPKGEVEAMLGDPELPFTLSLVTNENEVTNRLVVRRKSAGSSTVEPQPLALSWPNDLYSLSHVALPIFPEDPLYGGENQGRSPGIDLGDLQLRGERGVLQIPASDMLRLRWNPFYSYLEQRVFAFLGLAGPQLASGRPAGHAGSMRTAQNLNSGILPSGSSASMVSRFAAASR